MRILEKTLISGQLLGTTYIVICRRGFSVVLFLGLSLSSHGLHGFAYSLLVSQELHRLQGLQVLVELVEDGDACWQVQLHYGFI